MCMSSDTHKFHQILKLTDKKELKTTFMEEKTNALRTEAFIKITQNFSGSNLYDIYFILKSIKSKQTYYDFIYCSSHLSGSVGLLHDSTWLFRRFGKALIFLWEKFEEYREMDIICTGKNKEKLLKVDQIRSLEGRYISMLHCTNPMLIWSIQTSEETECVHYFSVFLFQKWNE